MSARSAMLLCILAFAVAIGCQKAAPPVIPSKPAEVVVTKPVIREVQEYEEFPGKLEASKMVELRAQVTGVLEAIQFTDGSNVAAGQVLFTIDNRTFKAEVEKAKAGIDQAKAKRDRLKKDYDRQYAISQTGAGSKEDLDRTAGELAEAESAIAVAEATTKLAQQQLDYCKIAAPFAGRVSRRAIDPGNIIKANETILTTIVATQPIYANFDIDERTFLKLRRISTQKENEKTTVAITLADEETPSSKESYRTGVIDFADNQVHSSTGTYRMRAVVENPNAFLSPGLFCRLKFPIGPKRNALVIPEEAVGSDQGQKYVFLVNDKDEVVYRAVTLGMSIDRMRVIERGLETTDRVITRGLQRVRPGVKVSPKDS